MGKTIKYEDSRSVQSKYARYVILLHSYVDLKISTNNNKQ